MKKIQMKATETMDETFERFVISRKSAGVTDKTIATYRGQYEGFKRYADNYNGAVEDFTEKDLAAAMGRMRKKPSAARR